MSLIMNLISEIQHLCERRKYVFMVLRKYTIISHYYYYCYSSYQCILVFVGIFNEKCYVCNICTIYFKCQVVTFSNLNLLFKIKKVHNTFIITSQHFHNIS